MKYTNAKKRKIIICAAGILLVCAVLFVAKFAKRDDSGPSCLTRTIPVMGTIAEIKIYGEKEILQKAAESAFESIKRAEERFSIFGEGEAVKLNSAKPGEPFHCSEELWKIFLEARRFHSLSGGVFDVSIRPLMILWGFYKKREQIPSDEELKAALESVGFEKLKMDDTERSIVFTREGMSVDFGGIVKGYAVDLAAKELERHGIKSGFVNIGGNIRCLDIPPPGKDFYVIGVRHPLKKNEICGTVKIKGRALATSGNYEKYVFLENKHITHIINPLNGIPVENMLSVTVLAPDAITADALSTSIFIGGKNLAEKIAKEIPGTEFLIIQGSEKEEYEIIKIGPSWNECGL
jgi:thiamine biosynthesis lipoprotein